MLAEPQTKRTTVFVDGQNLFYAGRNAFGHAYPNYDVAALAALVCQKQNWQLDQVRFYTGIPDAADDALWNHFWTAKLAQMGRQKVHVFSRPLRYRNQTIRLPNGQTHSFQAEVTRQTNNLVKRSTRNADAGKHCPTAQREARMKAKTHQRKGLRTGWYFESPFNDPSSPLYFDRGNWWTEDSAVGVSPVAAKYELARRHPNAGELLRPSSKVIPKDNLSAFLKKHATTKWPNLSAELRADWNNLVLGCFLVNLNEQAKESVPNPDWSDTRLYPNDTERERARKNLARRSRLEAHGEKMLRVIQRRAAEIVRREALKGRLILALEWTPDEVEDVGVLTAEVARIVHYWRERFSIVATKPHCTRKNEPDTTHSRLQTIVEFEKSELERFWDFTKAGKGRGKEKQTRLPQGALYKKQVNQSKRRNFQRIVEKAFLSLQRK